MNNVLVTGGTGSFGQAFVRHLMETDVERIVVYSRGEHAQEEMRHALDPMQDRLRFFIGDVRDYRRLTLAMRGVDTVVHAAALKVVPVVEYNVLEGLKTNALGAANVVEAALHADVEKVVALGTDKNAAPLNAYGATKLAAEKVFLAANVMGGLSTRFVCTRYGNVVGSKGSVVPFWRRVLAEGRPLPITDPDATRFWMTLDEAVALVMHALAEGVGGEVFVPDLPAYRLEDLAEAMDPGGERQHIGLRPGEKRHEVMISEDECHMAWRTGGYYCIIPHALTLDRTIAMVESGERFYRPVSSATAMRLTVEQLIERLGEEALV